MAYEIGIEVAGAETATDSLGIMRGIPIFGRAVVLVASVAVVCAAVVSCGRLDVDPIPDAADASTPDTATTPPGDPDASTPAPDATADALDASSDVKDGGSDALLTDAAPDAPVVVEDHTILYVKYSDATLYKIRPDGTAPIALYPSVPFAQRLNSARWSPDGTKILFSHYNPGIGGNPPTVAIMNSDGSGIVDGITLGGSVGWAPGGRMVFTRQTPATPVFKIYVANLDGSSEQFLVTGDAPTVSPDGKTLAFSTGEGHIYSMPFDGSAAPIQLLVPGEGTDTGPRWSPDGTHIAFTRITTTGLGFKWIMRVNPDGTNGVELTSKLGVAAGPLWSRAGTQIVYSVPSGGGGTVAIMNSDGTGKAPVVTGAFGAADFL